MKPILILAFCFLAAVRLFAAEGDIAAVGQKAPMFSGTASNGATVTLESLSGKVVLLNFFATWCGGCMVEMPRIEKEIWKTAQPSPRFEVIAVGREHTVEELLKWKEKAHVTFPVLADPQRGIYGKYATQGIPRSYVIGKDGVIKYAFTGYEEKEFEKLKAVIAEEMKR